MFANKPEDLSSVPKTQTIEGENQILQVVLWLPHGHNGPHEYMYIHTLNKYVSVTYNLKM